MTPAKRRRVQQAKKTNRRPSRSCDARQEQVEKGMKNGNEINQRSARNQGDSFTTSCGASTAKDWGALTQISNHMQQSTPRIPLLRLPRRVTQRVQHPSYEPDGAKGSGGDRLEEAGVGKAEEESGEGFEGVGVCTLSAVEAVPRWTPQQQSRDRGEMENKGVSNRNSAFFLAPGNFPPLASVRARPNEATEKSCLSCSARVDHPAKGFFPPFLPP